MKNITVDFSRSVGAVKPLHGANNGPVTFGSLLDVSRYCPKNRLPLDIFTWHTYADSLETIITHAGCAACVTSTDMRRRRAT
jgi:hypothetical protein